MTLYLKDWRYFNLKTFGGDTILTFKAWSK